MVNDGTGWKPVPMEPETKYVSRQELAKAATHVENVALTIDFTGREELLEALKKQAFCMCRKPEEQILWTMTINLLCDHEEG